MEKPEASIFRIPETSTTCYLSGIVALNIHSPNGTGDWHAIEVFFRPHTKVPRSYLICRGQPFDPSAFLGENGIYDAADVLDRMHVDHPTGPVYVATHVRAIADLVLVAVLRGESPDHAVLDEWMPADEDKQEVFSLLDLAIPHLDESSVQKIRQWIHDSLRYASFR